METIHSLNKHSFMTFMTMPYKYTKVILYTPGLVLISRKKEREYAVRKTDTDYCSP